MRKNKKKIVGSHAVMLMFYDLVMLGLVSVLLLVFYPSSYYPITRLEALLHYLLAAACMLGARALGNSYNNVWRYGGNNLYVNLICYDVLGGGVYFLLQRLLPLRDVEFLRAVTLFALNLLGDILMRQLYQYLYDANSRNSKAANVLRVVTQKLTGIQAEPADRAQSRRINLAIIGAGRAGDTSQLSQCGMWAQALQRTWPAIPVRPIRPNSLWTSTGIRSAAPSMAFLCCPMKRSMSGPSGTTTSRRWFSPFREPPQSERRSSMSAIRQRAAS